MKLWIDQKVVFVVQCDEPIIITYVCKWHKLGLIFFITSILVSQKKLYHRVFDSMLCDANFNGSHFWAIFSIYIYTNSRIYSYAYVQYLMTQNCCRVKKYFRVLYFRVYKAIQKSLNLCEYPHPGCIYWASIFPFTKIY